jgi:hypothetical protein
MRKRGILCAFILAGITSLVAAEGQIAQTANHKPDAELMASEPFEFDGTGQNMINLGNSAVLQLGPDDFTVQAWVNFADYCNVLFCDQSIVSKMAPGNFKPNVDGWYLLKQSDSRFWFCLGGGVTDGTEVNGCDVFVSTPTTVVSQTRASLEVWYSVAAVKTEKSISIYVNGVLEGTSALDGQGYDTNSAPVLIGINETGPAYPTAFFNGWVGEVRLYRRALSPAQVRAVFETSKAKYLQ